MKTRTILLDGLWGNPARLKRMQRNLEAGGVRNVETFGYNCSGFGCLLAAGAQLAERIQSGGQSVNLVGYSMGGLVIRSAIAQAGSLPVEKIAFLNTPHNGSQLARIMPGTGMGQMRPGSEFLQTLDSKPCAGRILAVWTPGDLMVIPGRSARWNKATETLCCRVPAHVWPLFSRTLHTQVARFLNES
jgi:triacylglycerol lipase